MCSSLALDSLIGPLPHDSPASLLQVGTGGSPPTSPTSLTAPSSMSAAGDQHVTAPSSGSAPCGGAAGAGGGGGGLEPITEHSVAASGSTSTGTATVTATASEASRSPTDEHSPDIPASPTAVPTSPTPSAAPTAAQAAPAQLTTAGQAQLVGPQPGGDPLVVVAAPLTPNASPATTPITIFHIAILIIFHSCLIHIIHIFISYFIHSLYLIFLCL